MLLMAEKKAPRKRQVNLRLTDTLIERLRRIGEPFGLEPPQVIRRAIEEYVQRYDPQPTQQPHSGRR